jgi:hypothetical protein
VNGRATTEHVSAQQLASRLIEDNTVALAVVGGLACTYFADTARRHGLEAAAVAGAYIDLRRSNHGTAAT